MTSRIATINADANATLEAKFEEIDAAGLKPAEALLAKFEAQDKMDAAVESASTNILKSEHDTLMRSVDNIHV